MRVRWPVVTHFAETAQGHCKLAALARAAGRLTRAIASCICGLNHGLQSMQMALAADEEIMS
jgi:hypothetical protein